MGEAEITVRRGQSRDMAFVTELWRKLADEMYGLDERVAVRPEAEILWAKWAGARLRDEHSCVLVAEVAGEVVGYLLSYIDEAQPIYVTRRHALISDLYVDPAHRRKGLGTKLVEKTFAFFREKEVDHVRVNVLKANAAAHAFWERHGAGEFLERLWKPLG